MGRMRIYRVYILTSVGFRFEIRSYGYRAFYSAIYGYVWPYSFSKCHVGPLCSPLKDP